MRKRLLCITIVGCILLVGCAVRQQNRWTVEQVAIIDEGLAIPECVLSVPGSDQIYISNIQTDSGGFFEDDGKGYITLATKDGRILKQFWLNSTSDKPIHAPKGMCILNGKLYFTDNKQMKRCDVGTGTNLETVLEVEEKPLNDMAAGVNEAFGSINEIGQLVCVKPDGTFRRIKASPQVNGVTCWKGKLYTASWEPPDLYEVDPQGIKEAIPFGLTEHFTNLDGIEVLDDGTFLVSDYRGHKVCAVTPDRKTVYTLIEMEYPADIGLDRQKGLLFVPQFMDNKVFIYKLSKK